MIRFPGRRRDQDGSLPMAMLLSLVGLSLSAILLPIAVNQITATRTDSDRTLALRAAQAGLNAVLGQFRAAADSSGAGNPSILPAGPFTGSVGPDGGERYRATIGYRDLDGNTLTLPLAAQPATAVVVSTGIAGATGTFGLGTAGTRTVQAVYSFELSNQNIPGGQIHVRSSVVDLCVDAGSAKPSAGTLVTMQRCTGSPAQQIWAYQNDLTIVLVSSRTTANPYGMCLEAGSPHTSGALVRVQACAGTSPASPQQMWSANDSANLMGTSDGASLDNYCFNIQNPDISGSLVALSNSNCWGGYDNVKTFQPDPAVGAGAAGTATRQLVNYQQFGRCLDVTNQWPGSPYMIAWPCKQAPNPANVSWNQKWTLPTIGAAGQGTGRLSVTYWDGTDYCLTSPGTVGGYPIMTACTSTSYPSSAAWTVYGDTGVYTTSYRITDSAGLCLAPADPAASPTEVYPYSGPPISRIRMATCDGSSWQKWNAPADLSKPLPLTQLYER